MVEDKLSHDERLRLECLAQANAFYATRPGISTHGNVVATAEAFEEYVKKGDS